MSKIGDIEEPDLKDYAIVCQEFSKESAEVIAYEIKTEITGHILKCLNLRSRFNPELHYYLIRRENLNVCIDALKVPFKSEITIEEGIIVEI